MMGYTVEELLARVGRRELPARMAPLDHLCLFVDNLHAQLREEQLHYMRWQVRCSAYTCKPCPEPRSHLPSPPIARNDIYLAASW